MLRIMADYHTHTVYSHGRGSVLDNARAAARAGLQAVAITDHGPGNLPWIGMRSLRDFDRIRRDAREAEERLPGLRVLVGVECNLMDPEGRVDVPSDVLARLDVVLAGFHTLIVPRSLRAWWLLVGRNWLARRADRAHPNLGERLFSAGPGRAFGLRLRRDNTRAVIRMIERNRIDVLTHPGLGIDIDTEEVARACAKTATLLELNAGHGLGKIDEAWVQAVRAGGARFIVGSDAHRPERVGQVEPMLRLAERAGLGPAEVVNVVDVRAE